MDGSVRIARVLGIPVEIHYTWFILFVLVAWSLSVGYFPEALPGLSPLGAVALGVTATVLLFAALLVHELAHSVVARREGLPIRGITLFVFGGVAQMTREPRTPGAEFRMAVAGPLASLGIAALFALLAWIGVRAAWGESVVRLFQYLAAINGIILLFNIVPAFPLDGGRIFRAALWYATGSLANATRLASLVGQGFAYLLMGWGLFRLVGGNAVGGLWLVFIGWFLLQAAQQGYQQVLIRRALRGVEARDLMREDLPAVPADLTLAEFVHDYLMRGRANEYCVRTDGEWRGIISLDDVRQVPRDRWDEVRVAEVMAAEDRCPTVRAGQSASEVLALMTQRDASLVAVRDRGRLVGTITRADIIAYIRRRLELEG
ncbi:MAG: site-2 protease family protein [Armatimonadota bacterium]|nr:site-2 protease family protein [Armatimonadota bacterium]MDR7502723.1 site-2 protease family protein [Armatimonadota bacterium]MDR7526747.1 site-2 protease family protein [Armatimonadota bacterium]MDR7576715.1 site-2 protease family protein [Armatimonadota bacterium]MDR7585807.1 site-2 protease family protein [Armatimonadota bacterium]